MKRPPVSLQSGGSCLSTIVLTISLTRFLFVFHGDEVSRLECPGFNNSGLGTGLCSWVRHFTLTYSASLHPGVQMGISELLLRDNPAMD